MWPASRRGSEPLAAFGLWDAPSVVETGSGSITQVLAQAVALGVTLLVLSLADAHHAPAAATTLLVSSGVAGPGTPLIGLVVGLAIVLACAPLLARFPGEQRETARTDAYETPMG